MVNIVVIYIVVNIVVNSGSKVMAISLKGWILPIGGASTGEGMRLQPAQQACSYVKSPQRQQLHV